jgi:heme-degrading monooxygenase HmoA
MEKIVKHGDVTKPGVEPTDALVLSIGWDSKDVHLAFRDTELFKENIALLREKNSGAELFHVSFTAG